MKKKISYKKAWEFLKHATPLETDCGMLCDHACCKGTADDGMMLFPGEEEMYPGGEDWYAISNSNVTLSDGTIIRLFVCNGRCNRDMRPLSCRIFPVIPYIDDLDYLEFVPDLRGAAVCPFLFHSDIYEISPVFIDALYSAFSTLIEDKKVLEFIEILSNQHDELAQDFKQFFDTD